MTYNVFGRTLNLAQSICHYWTELDHIHYWSSKAKYSDTVSSTVVCHIQTVLPLLSVIYRQFWANETLVESLILSDLCLIVLLCFLIPAIRPNCCNEGITVDQEDAGSMTDVYPSTKTIVNLQRESYVARELQSSTEQTIEQTKAAAELLLKGDLLLYMANKSKVFTF